VRGAVGGEDDRLAGDGSRRPRAAPRRPAGRVRPEVGQRRVEGGGREPDDGASLAVEQGGVVGRGVRAAAASACSQLVVVVVVVIAALALVLRGLRRLPAAAHQHGHHTISTSSTDTTTIFNADNDTRYDTTCYFNGSSIADMGQVYSTEPTTKKWTIEKLKSKKRICSEVSVNSPGNPWSQSSRRKGRLGREGIAEREGFKPGMKE